MVKSTLRALRDELKRVRRVRASAIDAIEDVTAPSVAASTSTM